MKSYLKTIKVLVWDFSGTLYPKDRPLQHDQDLINLFKRLKSWRHLMVTNTSYNDVLARLEIIGLNDMVFEKIISAPDMVGKLKPDPASFKAALKHTGLKPTEHLMIGDRFEKDLLPAKELGMRTCLVGSQSGEVDCSLNEVYDLAEFMIKSVCLGA